MASQKISFTITLPASSTEPSSPVHTEVARPLEPYSFYNLPPPQTQQALRLSRQIGVSIETTSPISLSVSSPPVTSTHPPPIHRPTSPPPLNIPTFLPAPIPRESPITEKDFLREHLHKFISHCHQELDILEGRRALSKLYKDNIAYETMNKKYEKMWTLWEESRKLFQLLNE